jgi:glucosamine-6-phosphate deaminase
MAAPAKSLTVGSLSVRIYPSQVELVGAAALMAQQQLQGAIRERGAAAAILATGNSQLLFLDTLVKLGGIEWSRVTLFHMDEYLGLSGDHPASFGHYMQQRVESRVHPGEFHFIEGDAPEPIKECERYEKLLRAQPIDLCVLGVGLNGHLAFNDPPVADFEDERWVKIVRLDETTRRQQMGYGYFQSIGEVPRYGLTLTIPALVSAKNVMCLAPGKGKAEIVKQLVRGEVSEWCPASVMRLRAGATLLLDAESAALL